MNHTYRLIWNEALCACVVAPENARAQGKRSSLVRRDFSVAFGGTAGRRPACMFAGVKLLVAAVLSALTFGAHALPTGGQISAGAGSIGQSGATMTVSQTTQNLAINWQSFGIAANESVNFNQPNASAIALNRVLGSDPSQILGQLNANGQVWVLNPNGVLFGRTAQVNVGGLVASTLNISDADFLAGKRTFTGSGGTVINQGALNADGGGYVALLGGQVSNEGVIAARLGTVALAAGDKVTLDFNGDQLLNVQVEQGALDALAQNSQLIRADGGTVLMTAQAADALATAVVNNTGVIEARSIENRNGVIKLLGDMDHGTMNVGGTLDASAPSPSASLPPLPLAGEGQGRGGFIETSAAHVKIADDAVVTTKSENGLTGTWLIDPVDFTIAASGGDMTGAVLTTALAGTNVTILSTDGATGTAGDVNVNDTVTWSANTLTLNAQNNININSAMMGSGTAGLALEYGQGAVAAGNSATYNVNAPVNLASTGSLSTKLGSDGAVKNYTIITTLGAAGSVTGTDLQGMNGNKNGNYVLGADIDASATSGWNDNGAGGFYGFAPVGTTGVGQGFTGSFDGLGHTISGLFINRPTTSNVGLFGATDRATLSNIGLDANITGLDNVGGLAGYIAGGAATNNSVGGTVNGHDRVGGLIGYQDGFSVTINITGSYATSNVTGNNQVGGLVGQMIAHFSGPSANLTDSYAAGSVSGASDVGGLVGYAAAGNSYVRRSYATGAVTGTSNVGGLLGRFFGSATNNFWDTQTTGQATSAGGAGVVGKTTAEMKSLATFTGAGWDIDDAGGTGKVWRIYDGYTTPLLRGFMTTLNATPDYDGSGAAMTNIGAYTIAGPYDAGQVLGTAGSTLTLSSTAADSYTASLGKGLYSTQQGYDIVTSRSIATPGSAAGDIALTSPIAWTSGTLAINTTGTVTDTAIVSGGGTAIFDLQNGTWSQVNASLPGFSVYDFRISGGSFVRALAGGGMVPYVLADIYGMQGMGSSGMLGNSYYLANDVDASGTANWNAGAGFVAVGNLASKFTGSFDGQGHTVTGLTINRPGWNTVDNYYQGLFGYATGSLSNVGLLNSSIYGAAGIGALAGRSDGAISNVYADGGSVTTSVHQAGGLVGALGGTGSIDNSYANVTVTGTDYACCGGGATSSAIGGLVGSTLNAGSSISNSYATGSVTGKDGVGGLVGQNKADITTSYATGAVAGTSYVGGLVGDHLDGTVTDSYWDSVTTGRGGTGGCSGNVISCVGTTNNLADIASAPYAQASYAGFDFTNTWRIYEGQTRPLLKSFLKPLTITANDAATTYSGTAYSGGNGVTLSDPAAVLSGSASYGGTSQGAVNAGSYTIAASGYWSNQGGYDISYANGTLTVNKASLSVTANAASKTYDGLAYNSDNGVVYSGFVNGETSAVLGGSLTYGGNSQGAVNAGSYAITPSGLTSGNYNIAFVDGALTVNPALLTVTANNAVKTYDGVAWAGGNGIVYSGFVNGETSTVLGGSLTYGGNSQGAVNAGSYAITPSGLISGNYTIVFNNGTLTIGSRVPTITGAPVDGYAGAVASVNVADNNTSGDARGESKAGAIDGSAATQYVLVTHECGLRLPAGLDCR